MKKFLATFLVSYLYGQWQPDVRITNYPNYLDYGSWSNAWTIAVKDSFVHIVWEHRLGTDPGQLYYVRSITHGNNFEPHQRLTTRDSHIPSISVFDSFVHIVWQEERDGNYEIYYNRSKDYGTTWDISNFNLTNNAAASGYPCISSIDSFVYVVFYDNRDGNYEIYYKRSKDYGRTWDREYRITNATGFSTYPSISSIDSFVYIVWRDNRDGNHEIYYNRSKDYGTTWDINNFNLTNNTASSGYPSISSTDSFVYIVWQDSRDGNFEIYYNRSKDYGRTWDINNFRLTDNTGSSEWPSISSIDSFVHIVWQDNRDGNFEIYYKKSKDYGNSWTADEKLTNTVWVGHPSIACKPCPSYDVHIVWTDYRDGNYEIYYKRHKCPPTYVKEDIIQNIKISPPCVGNIKFYLKLNIQADVELKIFDITGRLIDKINKSYTPGVHTIVWKNRQGIYFFLFKINNEKKTIKGIIL